jgi:hypothetical protein
MTKSSIDFLIIGAAKAGTTSLFRYLDAHPQIHMPGEKELNFFSSDERFSRGVDWYLSQWNDAKEGSVLWGEASPQYMQSPSPAGRIAAAFPQARLIALVRNPIERAYSHYLHAMRRHQEHRPFEELARRWINAPATRRRTNTDKVDPADMYFEGSQYGRILSGYLNWFPHAQIKLVFTEHLLARSQSTTQDIYRYLSVDASFTSECFMRVYNGGEPSRFLAMLQWSRAKIRRIRERLGFRRSIESLLPARFGEAYRSLLLRLETETGAKTNILPMLSQVRPMLAERYREDVRNLEAAFHVAAPWHDFNPPNDALCGPERLVG